MVLHRLNRKEYSNAVRDLLAVDYDADTVLPPDDIADGFDNIAEALQVSPSFIEQYVIAARAVAVKALGRPDARPGGWTFRAGPGTQLTHVPGLPLGTAVSAPEPVAPDGRIRNFLERDLLDQSVTERLMRAAVGVAVLLWLAIYWALP